MVAHRLPARRPGRRQDRPATGLQIGLVLLWIAALLTLYTGWDYFRAGMKHISWTSERA
jgi:phosphatidylglycerophosphate synthase